MKPLLITEQEKKEILNLHYLTEQTLEKGVNPMTYFKKYGKDPKAWQSMLLCLGADLGKSGPLKNGVDGQFGKISKKELKRIMGPTMGNKEPKLDAETFFNLLLKSGYKCLTKNVPQGGQKKQVEFSPKDDKKTVPEKKKQQEGEYTCIAVSKEICKTISANRTVSIGKDSETYQCAAYVIKCLSQYENLLGNFSLGNAWKGLDNMKNSGGKEKFNLFTNGYNWDGLQKDIEKINYKDSNCKEFQNKKIQKGSDVDSEVDQNKLSNVIAKNYPSSSSIDLQNLELGDVVGIYLPGSSNKSRAFCDSAGLDSKGNIKNKNATLNTHVGFIGAMKNNQPIVFHNIHGEFYAQPAKDFINSKNAGMIVWAVSDPDVKRNIEKRKKVESGIEEPNWYEKNLEPTLYDWKRKITQYIP